MTPIPTPCLFCLMLLDTVVTKDFGIAFHSGNFTIAYQ